MKKFTLETSGEDVKLHSKRVEKMQNHIPNEWRRFKITLETSGEDLKLHSKRVEKIRSDDLPRAGQIFAPSRAPYVYLFRDVLQSEGRSTNVYTHDQGKTTLVSSVFCIFYTRFECILHLLHSFRVYFASSPLVSSVISAQLDCSNY